MNGLSGWAEIIAQLLGVLLAGTGLWRLIEAFMGRRKVRADAADVLTDSVTEWAKELKDEAAQARIRADALNATLDVSRDKAAELASQVRTLAYELEVAFAKLRRWKRAIKDEGVSRGQLASMVDADFPNDYPNTNNRGGVNS